MSRPKKGEKGSEEATKKWRETMEKKYGGAAELHKKMQLIGSKGGAVSKGGGFAADPERAKICGSLGGLVGKAGERYNFTISAKNPEGISPFEITEALNSLTRRPISVSQKDDCVTIEVYTTKNIAHKMGQRMHIRGFREIMLEKVV